MNQQNDVAIGVFERVCWFVSALGFLYFVAHMMDGSRDVRRVIHMVHCLMLSITFAYVPFVSLAIREIRNM